MTGSVERQCEFLGFDDVGYVEAIIGPMFSGKSDELIFILGRAQFAQKKVQAFKPVVDNRRSENTINSYTGRGLEATSVSSSWDILIQVEPDTKWVGIDEAQFFDDDLPEVCRILANRGIRVIVAGLSADFRNEPFGPMDALMRDAEVVHKLTAYCEVCGRPASRTQRIVNGVPAKYTDPVVVIGAEESYQARCPHHHEVPSRPVKLPSPREAAKMIKLVSAKSGEIDDIVAAFGESQNLADLVSGISAVGSEISGNKLLVAGHLSTVITDRMQVTSPAGLELIIYMAKELGISGQKNFRGKRLQAKSCLEQMLLNN
jgi:thymidine kinase